MLRTRVRVGPASGVILSLVFAALLTAAGSFDVFVDRLNPLYGEPSPVTLRVPFGSRIVRTDGPNGSLEIEHKHRSIVVPLGTVLDPNVEEHRAAVEFERQRRPPKPVRLASVFALYLFLCLVLTSYFQKFGHTRLRLMRSQGGLFALLVVVALVAKLTFLFTALPVYWVPAGAVALWVAIGFDRRTAMLLQVTIAFVVASLLRFDLLIFAVFISRGVTATFLFLNRKKSRQMIYAGTASGFLAAFAYLALLVVFEGQAAFALPTLTLASPLVACVGGGALSGLLAFLFREPGQLAFGHVSRNRLLDLTDIEAPLLRQMAAEAPGSWEHSRAMANLAEAASAAIGADSLLTRAGAYYHDLGKTVQSKYFVENLLPGEPTPHDDLEPEVSADAIMAHVVIGTKILREGDVPEPVVEFAYTHHGTQRIEYFWNKYEEKEHVEGEPRLDESHFRYPGMRPMSKETAILMLVDSVEAASRTIQPPSHKKFEEMIQRIVFHKLQAGQLDESGLTLTDLRLMTKRMAATLVNMFHGRIKYPWQREQEKKELEAAEAKKALEEAEKAAKDAETAAETAEKAPEEVIEEPVKAKAPAKAPVKAPVKASVKAPAKAPESEAAKVVKKPAKKASKKPTAPEGTTDKDASTQASKETDDE